MAEKPTFVAVIALPAILLVTYSIVLIIAGHGIAPLAFFLLLGDPNSWLLGQLLGWAGIVGLVAVVVLFRDDPLKLAVGQLTAAFFLYFSWLRFVYVGANSGAFWANVVTDFVTSAPFQVAFVITARILIKRIARHHKERNVASSSSSEPC